MGKSPVEPHGEPLSTRMRTGIPQRAKAARSVATVSVEGTFLHRPEGKNAGQEHGAGVFLDDPQPRDLDAAGQADLLGGVPLPDVMGPQGALARRRGQFGSRRSCQIVASEPSAGASGPRGRRRRGAGAGASCGSAGLPSVDAAAGGPVPPPGPPGPRPQRRWAGGESPDGSRPRRGGGTAGGGGAPCGATKTTLRRSERQCDRPATSARSPLEPERAQDEAWRGLQYGSEQTL